MTENIWLHKPKPVVENNKVNIVWDFWDQDRQIDRYKLTDHT